MSDVSDSHGGVDANVLAVFPAALTDLDQYAILEHDGELHVIRKRTAPAVQKQHKSRRLAELIR